MSSIATAPTSDANHTHQVVVMFQSKSEIDNLAQETDNKRLSWNLMNADLGLKALETKLKRETVS